MKDHRVTSEPVNLARKRCLSCHVVFYTCDTRVMLCFLFRAATSASNAAFSQVFAKRLQGAWGDPELQEARRRDVGMLGDVDSWTAVLQIVFSKHGLTSQNFEPCRMWRFVLLVLPRVLLLLYLTLLLVNEQA